MERIILDVTYLAELRTTETGIRPKDKFGSDVFHRGFLMFLRLMETQSKTSDRSNSRQTQVYSEVENKQFEIIVARIFSKLDLGKESNLVAIKTFQNDCQLRRIF